MADRNISLASFGHLSTLLGRSVLLLPRFIHYVPTRNCAADCPASPNTATVCLPGTYARDDAIPQRWDFSPRASDYRRGSSSPASCLRSHSYLSETCCHAVSLKCWPDRLDPQVRAPGSESFPNVTNRRKAQILFPHDCVAAALWRNVRTALAQAPSAPPRPSLPPPPTIRNRRPYPRSSPTTTALPIPTPITCLLATVGCFRARPALCPLHAANIRTLSARILLRPGGD